MWQCLPVVASHYCEVTPWRMTHVLAVFGADIVSLSECPSMLSTAWGANTQMHTHTYTHKLRHSHRHCEQQRTTATVSGDTAALPTLSYYLIWGSAQGYICQSVLDGPERLLLSGKMYKKKRKEKKIMTKKTNIFIPKCLRATCCPLSSGLDAWHEWFVCVTKNLTLQTYNREGESST